MGEANMKRYELDIEADNADLEHQHWLLDHKGQWYKFWNYRVWSDVLPLIEQEIARLETKIKTTRKMFDTANETIINLKDARDWVHDASVLALKHESQIDSLHNQLMAAKQNHATTVAANAVKERQAKEAGDAKVRAFEEQLAVLNT